MKAYQHLASFREELPFDVWFTRILIPRQRLNRIEPAPTPGERWSALHVGSRGRMSFDRAADPQRRYGHRVASGGPVARADAARPRTPAADCRRAREAAGAATLGIRAEPRGRSNVTGSERADGTQRVHGPRAPVPGDTKTPALLGEPDLVAARPRGTEGKTPCHSLPASAKAAAPQTPAIRSSQRLWTDSPRGSPPASRRLRRLPAALYRPSPRAGSSRESATHASPPKPTKPSPPIGLRSSRLRAPLASKRWSGPRGSSLFEGGPARRDQPGNSHCCRWVTVARGRQLIAGFGLGQVMPIRNSCSSNSAIAPSHFTSPVAPAQPRRGADKPLLPTSYSRDRRGAVVGIDT